MQMIMHLKNNVLFTTLRVTSLDGLGWGPGIDYDPDSVEANELSAIEYNRLRSTYRPNLRSISVQKRQFSKTGDRVWAVSKAFMGCQLENKREPLEEKSIFHGLHNTDGISDYANAIIQCIFQCKVIRDELLRGTVRNKDLLTATLRNPKLSTISIRQIAGTTFVQKIQQDALELFKSLCSWSVLIKNSVRYRLTRTVLCKKCNYTMTSTRQLNHVLRMAIPSLKKISILQDIVNST